MTDRIGWQCPLCRVVHSPDVRECRCAVGMLAPGWSTGPHYPNMMPRWEDVTCGDPPGSMGPSMSSQGWGPEQTDD